MLCPVAAAAHSLVPAGEQTGALSLVHLRGKGHVAVPQAADLVPVLPHTGGKARQIGSAQSGRLPDGRAQHGLVQDVGLELHQELVTGCTAVHLQRGDGYAGVLFHSSHEVCALVGNGFFRRADDVVLGGAAGDAHNGTAGVHIPIGRAETGEGGHDVDAAVVRHLLSVVFRIAALLDHAQAVAHPLDDGTAHKDAALQSILHLAVQADADELFTPDSAMLEDIRIFKGGRIDRAILYSASVLSKCCNTLSGLFRQIIEDRTDILYPVKDLEVHRGLGFSAWCDNNRILIGTRAYMEKEEVPLPDEEYEAKHSKNGELQILYLAVSGSLHAMFVLHYVGGRNAARGLEVLQRENIRLLVTCEDPSLTARHITEAYHLPEGMITLLDQEQCSALTPAQPDETARCCMLHDKGFASLIGGLRAAEKAQNAETTATTVQLVSVWFSVAIAVLLTYAGSVGMLSVAAVLMYQAAWSALSIAVCALKQHS